MKNLLFLLIWFTATTTAAAQITYVNPNATGNGDGSNWQDAYTDLRVALENTEIGDIWIAEGVYTPTTTNNREVSFHLQANIDLYGGFPDNGTPGLEDRDWEAYTTVLSGDLGILGDTSDNSFTVLRIDSRPDNAENTVDGCTITQGVANYGGGGVDISGASFTKGVVNLRHCTFKQNFAGYQGAGVDASSVVLNVDDCLFEDNYSGYEGAGIDNSQTSLFITNSIFRNNYADYEGAAISHFPGHYPINDYSLQIINTVFEDNSTGNSGAVVSTRGRVELFNCLFEANFTNQDGGVFDLFQWGLLTATNCTFAKNEAGQRGSILSISSGIDTAEVSAHFKNSIFFRNLGLGMIDQGNLVDEITFSHCLLSSCPSAEFCDGTNVITSDPGFVSDEDYRLRDASACIDAGLSEYFPVSILEDLVGNDRITGNAIDIGAYEYEKSTTTSSLSNFGVEVYPNPATSYIVLEHVVPELFYASLFDANGRQIRQWRLGPTEKDILLINDLPAGIYYLKLHGPAKTGIEKILIR